MKPAPAKRAGIHKPIELQIFISHIFNFRKIITVEFNCSVLGFFYGFDFFFTVDAAGRAGVFFTGCT